MPSSHSHALIYDAIGKTDAFREAMEYLVDYYKTHGNLQDEQCKRLLRKMAARAGVGIGPLVSFVRLEGNVGNEGVDYGKASEEFNQQKEMPHITNSKKTSSRRMAQNSQQTMQQAPGQQSGGGLSFSKILGATGKILGFSKDLATLYLTYKTHKNLNDPNSQRILKKLATQAGVGVRDLMSYISKQRQPTQQVPQQPAQQPVPQPAQQASRRNIMANRRAKLDIMTGFSNIEKIDGDQGAKGSGYFPKWTTVGLPDQGRNDAIDDDQQKTGSGAPETSFPGAPLKTPMEADDVKRPKIREGREATRSRALRKVASEIRLLSPVLSRRLLAAAEELSYDDLSTAALPVSGDEPNEVDDHQDGGGHGTLAFFGTDAAKATSLTRKSSRRVKANPCEVKEVENGFILVNDAGEKVKGPFKSESEAHEAKVKLVEEGEDENRSGTMQYASQRRKLSSRRQAADKKDNNIDVSHALAFVKKVLDGENYDRGAVSRLWENESKRVSDLLSGNQTTPAQAAAPHVANGDTRTANRRRARAQGDAPLKPISAPPDEDGVGADGAGGFAHKSKAPLQKSMNADDVKRPRIRENPEASKSLWAAFKHIITKRGDVGGTWNDGRYTISSRDYGNTLEVSASVKDREGIHMPVGSMTISLINDSPSGRFASVELNDGLVENRVLEFTMKPKTASRIASWIFKEASDISKETLEHVGVS